MKACIVQPFYTTDLSRADELFKWELEALDKCDGSMDIIVFPEACDVPCFAPTREIFLQSVEKYCEPLVKKAAETARRCNSLLFINVTVDNRNTTLAFDRHGGIVGKYQKQHLTPGETAHRKLDSGYSFEFSEPYTVEIEGLKFGFLTCYDFYFYENFSNLARQRLDIIIGCSHQRSDMQSALETMTKFCAYSTNSYVLRASVSMGEDSEIGGGSMAAAPDGSLIINMKSKIGMECFEFDPTKKYYKPAGFNNPDSAHWEYTEKGRRPWKYRPAGSAVVRWDSIMPYPRICAHRGFCTAAPENSMPAFGAAIALGAQEIEFDLWYTSDGHIVSAHDKKLSHVSDGDGLIYEHTLDELMALDSGVKFDRRFAGLKIVTLEEILKKFACHAVMNIHIKTPDNSCGYDSTVMEKIIALIDKYDCRRHVYFMCGNDNVLKLLGKMAPDICRCQGAGDRPWEIVERALENGCQKVQFFKPYFNREMVERAHANGLHCNVFFADDPNEAKEYLEMGMDTILTNDYNRVSQILKED